MRTIPFFKYHPDPIGTRVFERLNAPCDCCGEESEWLYTPAVYAEAVVDALCPWCIASGKAFEKFGAVFTPIVGGSGEPGNSPWPSVPDDVRDEIQHRTPGIAGHQEEKWWAHCNDGGEFLGYVGDLPKEIFASPAAGRFVALMKQVLGASDEEWEALISTPDRTHSVTIYVFRCLHCGELGGYGDCS